MGSSDSMDSVVDLEKSGISTMPTVHEQQAGEWDHYVETESSFVRDDLDQVDQAPQTPGAVGRVPEKPKFPRNYSKVGLTKRKYLHFCFLLLCSIHYDHYSIIQIQETGRVR